MRKLHGGPRLCCETIAHLREAGKSGGKQSVLIIRESGSKMPADLGGDVYATLPDRSSISPIERGMAAFLDAI